ncbi:cystathionine gamma-lyase [Pieris napi]|uniref:cystathionine gamma-lyase n=1 Tax=Pieris napi TaxID=78633 RepID=UPI001FBA0B42|nr:cystathionine gamma-lyase [Pieris napi]XP_047505980.1 cystathionine gamma-lyase [Pieris napi]
MGDQGFLKQKSGFATLAIRAGQDPDKWESKAVVMPIVTATTFKQTGPAEYKEFDYSRSGNPTRNSLEECLAALDGGKYGLTFASGLGAITTVVTLLNQGEHILCCDDVYGGTNRLLRNVLERHGIEVSFADFTNVEYIKNSIKDNTKMLWVETPTNPLLKVIDMEAVVKIAKPKDIIVVVDNTFLTPYLQRPLDFGVDVVLYSITKYMNGHADVIMGAIVVNDDALEKKLRFLQNSMGIVPSPMDCYLVSRSLKTLALRMEQHKKSSLIVANWLVKHPNIIEVLHPGLPSHPQYEIAKRQMSGHSGTFSFRHNGDLKESQKLLRALKMFMVAESLGGYESLAELPTLMTHASVPAEQRAALGITHNLIRISVGLEDVEDLIQDLDQSFKVAFE